MNRRHFLARLAAAGMATSLPSSMPNGTTASALRGAGNPGIDGIALSTPT